MKRDVKVPVYSYNRELIGYIVYDTKTMLAWNSIEKTTAAYGDLHEGIGDGGIHLVGDKLIRRFTFD